MMKNAEKAASESLMLRENSFLRMWKMYVCTRLWCYCIM